MCTLIVMYSTVVVALPLIKAKHSNIYAPLTKTKFFLLIYFDLFVDLYSALKVRAKAYPDDRS